MACKPTVLIGVGIALLVIGILISLIGPLVIPAQLDSAFASGLDDYVVIDSTDAQGYEPWSGGQDKTSTFYYVAYMWNLTNADDVRGNGETPRYVSVGPYYYRRYKHAENVSFPDNGNLIRYSMPEHIEFDRELSVGDETDLITNVNPAYVAILSQFYAQSGQTGTEFNMVTAAGSGFIPLALDWFLRTNSPSFNTLYSAYRFNGFFASLYREMISKTNETYFMSQWANATQTENGWRGLLVSENGTASGISAESAKLLFQDTNCGFLAPNTTDCALLWYSAQIDQPSRSTLLSDFKLTEANLDAIVNWMNKFFAPIHEHPAIFSEFRVANVSDLGWKQYFDGSVLGKTLYGNESECHAVSDNWPTEGYNIFSPVEVVCLATQVANPTDSARARYILTDPQNGLANMTVFQQLLENGTDFERIHMTKDEADFFGSYVLQFMMQSSGYLKFINGPSGGFLPARSVRSWLWDCQDMLLDILQPGHQSCSILDNNTYYYPSTIYSGKSDLSQANVYKSWRSDNGTVYGWERPINVSGHSVMGQFQPGLKINESIWVFDDDLVRPLRLNYTGNAETVKDIPVFTYLLDFNQSLGANSLYFSPITGLTNVSTWKSGSPAFLSLWDMHGVNDSVLVTNGSTVTPVKIREGVIGMNSSLDEWSSSTVLKIEPITGNTVSAEQRIQVNVLVDAYNGANPFDFTFGNGGTLLGLYWPLARILEHGLIGDGDADMLKSKLNIVPEAKKAIFYVSVIGGPLLFLVGIFMLIVGIRRRNQGYQLIN